MILADFHTHTHLSTDSTALPEQQVQAAIAAGLKHMCFTDHQDIDFPPDYEGEGAFLIDMERYQKELLPLKTFYQEQISLHFGIELGLQPHLAKEIPAFTDSYPFEFLIGSTHLTDRMDMYYPSYWEGRSVAEGIRRYYETTLENVQLFDCFDVYGHLDYIIRYAPVADHTVIQADYMNLIDEILKTLISKGKGIECNTAGFKYGLGAPNPCEKILRHYRELGGELLTVGSDSHQPEHIAYAFEKVPKLLQECGFRYYTIFQDRKPVFLPL